MTYKTVQPKIAAHLNPDNFHSVVKFVSLTIQQPFYTMHDQIASVNKVGLRSPYVWGNKIKTFEWLKAHPKLVSSMYTIIPSLTDEEALGILTEIPGIGPAKAGFVMQLVFGRVGCLDIHNFSTIYSLIDILKELDIKYNKDNKYNIKDYLSICRHIGVEQLWDNWCTFIDNKYPDKFKDISSSEYHLKCIKEFK